MQGGEVCTNNAGADADAKDGGPQRTTDNSWLINQMSQKVPSMQQRKRSWDLMIIIDKIPTIYPFSGSLTKKIAIVITVRDTGIHATQSQWLQQILLLAGVYMSLCTA